MIGQTHCFSPLMGLLDGQGTDSVMEQMAHIMSQETKERKREGLGSHNPLPGYAPGNLKAPTRLHF